MKDHKSQREMTVYFHKVVQTVPDSLASPSTSSTSATPDTARPTPSFPPYP